MPVCRLPPPTVSRARSAPPTPRDEPPEQDGTAAATSAQLQLSPEDEIEIKEWMEERQRNGPAKGKARMDESIEEEHEFDTAVPGPGLDFTFVPLPTPALTPLGSTTFKPFSTRLPAPPASPTSPLIPTTPRARPGLVPEPGPSHQQASPGGKASEIPLNRLFPAGTVVLHRHTFSPDAVQSRAEDGWTRFSEDLLRAARPDDDDEDELRPLPAVLAAAPTTPSKKRRRTSSSGTKSSPKRVRLSSDPLVDLLVANTASRSISATALVTGSSVIVRIYLIPQDLPELLASARRRKAAGATVMNLLGRIRVAESEWAGNVCPDGDCKAFLDEPDTRSLLEVYRDIESPSHDPNFVDQLDAPEEVRERIAGTLLDNPVGISTQLFPYQLATLAKMLSREIAPQKVVLPTYIRRRSAIGGQEIFVSTDGHVCLEPRSVREPKGGILAEDMGVGKSLITLALVASTLNELPDLRGTSTYLDGSFPSPDPVLLTSVSQNFPFATEMAEERKARPRLPELLPGVILDAKEQLEYDEAQQQQLIEDSREVDLPFPSLRSLMLHTVKTSPVALRYTSSDAEEAGGTSRLPQLLFDTLQTTPPFYRLLPSVEQQHSREGRRGGLLPQDIVVAATTLVVVPTDLVRQWESQIKEHVEPHALRCLVLRTAKDKFRSAAEMATYDLILMSVARFSDAAEATDTSLRGVHWKRLVIDEGHVLSNGTRMRKLAHELRTESRWAVSGTPSTNLRVTDDADEAAMFATPATAGGDRTDYDRLGQLFSRFVQHAAFPKPDMLRKTIQAHVHEGGERPARLAQIFDRAIIRHRPQHVKQAFSLPPLSKRTVQIDMEDSERRVYNSLLALFVSNAVTSQRVDVDYLFHSSKRAHLDTLSENVASATTFFGSQDFIQQISDARKFAKEMSASYKSLAWTDEERVKEAQVIEVFDEVLADPAACLTVDYPSIAFEVTGFPNDLFSTFRGLHGEGATLVPASELVRLRVDVTELRRVDVKEWDDEEEFVEELLTFEQKRKRIDARPKNYKPDEDEQPLFKKRGKNAKVELAALPDVIQRIQLGRTTSAKINHIIGELKRYPNDKFIVFSSSRIDLLFANLSEALDLLSIRHKIFAGGHAKGGDRGSIVQHFNTTTAAECQAILVDAKLGGRGINLTAASRVIMLEPIWRPDLEVQAEKRAHRLGQTKPVDLQVLVVKSSFEDALLQRRAQLLPEDFAKRAKAPQQDAELRGLLQEARYLEPREGVEREKLASNSWGRVNLFRSDP